MDYYGLGTLLGRALYILAHLNCYNGQATFRAVRMICIPVGIKWVDGDGTSRALHCLSQGPNNSPSMFTHYQHH